MSKIKYRREMLLNLRYILAGILNTGIGLSSIWMFSLLGLVPLLANLLGYILGLTVGFFTSKKFVFRSQGHLTKEGVRFMLAFLCSYALNLIVLYGGYAWMSLNVMVAQAVAMFFYIMCMYFLSRFLVFNAN